MNVGKSGCRLMGWPFKNTVSKTKYEGYVMKTMVLVYAVFSEL